MTSPDASSGEIEKLRKRIDDLDTQIVRLINERASVVVDIGAAKRVGHTPTYAPDREQRVLQHVRAQNDGPLPSECLEKIYRELMSGSFALEHSLRIGYLGPDGSFSHLAASRQFGSQVDYVAVNDIADVFGGVDSGELNLGLVPIENSTGGGVSDTLDSFMEFGAKVCAEVLVAIHHNFLTNEELDAVKVVYSRPEVFVQCRRWLADHIRQAERVPMASSARAAECAAEEVGASAIGSSLAAEIYGLRTVYASIEDNPNNVTRFFVIGNQQPEPTGEDKTALMFTTAHRPGALAEVLEVFRDSGVNLTHIDKRPSQTANWEYCFFIDCEGHRQDEQLTKALDVAREHCLHLVVLGSFPRATSVLG